MSVILNVSMIEKYYGNRDSITKALDNISFEVEEGEFVGIMGPSGSGKTTLLNCISTIDSVSTGHIYLHHQDITHMKRKALERFRREQLGFIFQDFNLLPSLNGYENIALALTIQGSAPADIHARIHAIAQRLKISDVLNKYPQQMSGGERQRIACARALITQPSLILADEPTGALDSKNSRLLLETMEQMNEEYRSTIMMVTHDPFSASYTKRILFIKDGKIFNELIRGSDSRKEFFQRIIDVTTLLGGDDVVS